MKKIPSKQSTSWGRVASWYSRASENPGSYQQTLIFPNLKRLLAIKTGERVCDIGCGAGLLAEQCAASGASVVGIDLSKEFILAAQQRAREKKLPIRYHIGSGEGLGMIADGSIDTATIVLAIQNMNNQRAVFAECSRALKKSGRLVIVMNHPAFRIPQHSEWGWDIQNRTQYRRVDAYLSELSIPIHMHPGSRKKEITTSFHRPLQSIMGALRSTGFAVVNLEEWISNKKSDSGPRAALENRARKEFPLFLYLEMRKISHLPPPLAHGPALAEPRLRRGVAGSGSAG